LNKYDFHKVRQNNEDSGQSPYGQGAWEFKHPEFQQDKKDSLDNIRRKAPAPRKATQAIDDVFPAQQIDLVNTQLVATQHQLQNLQERYHDLADSHVTLLRQVVPLQKIVKNHDAVMHRVMGFLHTVDAQRRASSVAGGPFTNSSGMGMGEIVGVPPDDHPASPLQQASQLLGEISADNLVSKDLEQRAMDYNFLNDYTTPPQDQSNSSMVGPSSEASNPQVGYTHHQDLESMVYPVGQTNGIDPVNREHIHNIPYAPPPNIAADAQPDAAQTRPAMEQTKKSYMDPGWGVHKPRILLVEDDKTCARIGCKFLQNCDCEIETAVSVTKSINVTC
jgi:osomolarity two-component system, response regulator SKN7